MLRRDCAFLCARTRHTGGRGVLSHSPRTSHGRDHQHSPRSRNELVDQDQQRSRAKEKLEEINRKFAIFRQIGEFVQQPISPPVVAEPPRDPYACYFKDYDAPAPPPPAPTKPLLALGAVDFGASPGGFAQVLTRELRRINASLAPPNGESADVVTVDHRMMTPMRGTRHLRGSLEDRQVMKRVHDVVNGRKHEAKWQRPREEVDVGVDVKESRRRVVIVTNDTVSVVRGRFGDRDNQGGDRQQLSVTYAQNNLAMCSMRRATELLESFRPPSDIAARRVGRPIARGATTMTTAATAASDIAPLAVPPCFFVTKLLRSIHQNRVVDAARKVFDGAELVQLGSSPSPMELYLVCWTRPRFGHGAGGDGDSARADVAALPLPRNCWWSLPPGRGEAREWVCWGCFKTRSGSLLQCPMCGTA